MTSPNDWQDFLQTDPKAVIELPLNIHTLSTIITVMSVPDTEMSYVAAKFIDANLNPDTRERLKAMIPKFTTDELRSSVIASCLQYGLRDGLKDDDTEKFLVTFRIAEIEPIQTHVPADHTPVESD